MDLAGLPQLSLSEGGYGGSQRTCLYVVMVQEFLSDFKSNGSRGSTAFDWSASGHPGANRRSLACVDQNAG